jgi:outer membrane lipoprotein-sorting protein
LGVIKPGTKITIPNDYAAKMEMYIHKDLYYPVYLKIYDHKGLFEEYTFTNVELNPLFKDIEFSAKNPGYGF